VTAPTSEIGYASQGATAGGVVDVARRRARPGAALAAVGRVYDRMRRGDAQVISALLAVKLPIERTTWRLDPNGVPPGGVRAARRRPRPAGRRRAARADAPDPDRFSWTEHLRLALLKLDFGHSVFEQVYRFDEHGLFRLRKLAPRLPKTIAAWNVAATAV
jgi:hypothetical protein